MSKNEMKNKQWPANCPWPDVHYQQWGEYDADDVTDAEIRIDPLLADIANSMMYLAELREKGEEPTEENWPEGLCEDYWHDGEFDEEQLQADLEYSMGRLKLFGCDAVYEIERLIGYNFGNEMLLMQAFIRRAFAQDYGLEACNEELEFFGDAALAYTLTRTMSKQYGKFTLDKEVAFFKCKFNEGDMSNIRRRFICKEYLAEKSGELGLDKYILYGIEDKETESAKENMMEALIGAVAIDSDWDYRVLDCVIDKLLNAHLEDADNYLKKDYYDIFNSWHQKKWGQMPEYEVYRSPEGYHCVLRFFIPKNDKGLNQDQRIDVDSETASKARSNAAETACEFLKHYGLWMNLADSGIEPDEANSINQLQELFQKKYVDEPQYDYEDTGDNWKCVCKCDASCGEGYAKTKKEAKKKAAYITLCRLFQSAGINKPEWNEKWLTMSEFISEE